ncbi:MAG: PaaI family thioesterase [Anderseniella sp.]|nr:PaaI family thioesterase [Anderseniella sp.]
MALKWSGDEVFAFLEREFPQALHRGLDYEVVSLEPDALDLRASADDRHLRPGGTISGPTMMELVDCAIYVLLLAHHREEARLAVTTNLAISFLRKPKPGPLVAKVRLIKHGRTLTVARTDIISEADGKQVASSEATYFMGGAG